MASVEASQLSKADHDELCCAYAALLLHDEGLEITVSPSSYYSNCSSQGEKLSKVIKASGNSVEAYWPTLFSKALNTANIGELLQNVVTAAPVAAGAGPAAAVEEEAPKEEKKEEVEDVDMGGLFGGDDDEY